MLNCDYTSNTSYQFYEQIDESNPQMSKVGVYPENKIENVLNGAGDSDKWVQFYVPEIVDIPSQKPDVEGIISLHSSITIISKRVIKTPVVTGYTNTDGSVVSGETIPNAGGTKLTGRKLVVEGFLTQKIIYTAAELDQAVHSANFVYPFSVFIVIDKDTPLSQQFAVTPYIEDLYACQLSPRSIFKNTTIFIKATKLC